MQECLQAPEKSENNEDGQNFGWLFGALPWSLWVLFILYCVSLNFSRGVGSADDAFFATVAKSVAVGEGYATPFHNPQGQKPFLFNPEISTGPTVILPCALLIRVFGNREVLPGVCAIGLWFLPITIFLILLHSRFGFRRFSLATALLLYLWVSGTENMFLWCSFFGETPAVSLLLLAHWIAATKPISPKNGLLVGILAGLAVLTKLIALFSLSGVFVILAFRMWALRRERHWSWLLLCGCVFLVAVAAPYEIFEGAKRLQLGHRGYSELVQVTRNAINGYGGPRIPNMERLRERWLSLRSTYSFWYLSLPILIALAVRQWRTRPQLAGVTLSMAISSLAGTAYCFCAPLVMPRWAFIPVVLALTGLAIQIASMEWRKPWAQIVIVLLCSGLIRLFVQHQLIECRSLFHPHPGANRIARKETLQYLLWARSNGPVVLVSPGWAHSVDIEYLMPTTKNFALDSVPKTSATKLMLVQTQFAVWSGPLFKKVLASSPPIVFTSNNYQVYRLP